MKNSLTLATLLGILILSACTKRLTQSDYVPPTGESAPKAAFSFDISSHDFGTSMMQTTSSPITITLTNTSSNDALECLVPAINRQGSQSFYIQSTTCTAGTFTAGSSCTATVYAKLGLTGENKGQLYFSCRNATAVVSNLTGTGTAMITQSTTAINFSGAFLDTDAPTQDIVFTNSNTETKASGCTIATLNGNDASEFIVTNDTCSSTDIDTNSTCTVSVSLHPKTLGVKKTLLAKNCTIGGTFYIALVGLGAQLTNSPSSLSFGTTYLNVSSPTQTIAVTNLTGSSASTCSSPTLSGTDASSFTIDPTSTCNSSSTLANGSSCTIILSTFPLTTGAKNATVNFNCTDGATISAALSATASSNAIALDTNSYNFSDVFLTTASASKTFTVTNSSANSITGCTNPSLTGTNAAQFTITGGTCSNASTINASGGTCTIIVTANPTTTGAKSATLNFSCPSGGALNASLSANGVTLSKDQNTINFGNVLVNTTSSTQTLTITNNTTANATGCGAPTLTGANSAQFSLAGSTTCAAGTLAAGASCLIVVQATPTSTGAKTAAANYPCTYGTTTAPLAVTGTQVALSIAPANINFSQIFINASSAPQTFTITNNGSASATGCSSATLTGNNPTEFSITGGTCGANDIGVGSNCTVIVQANPNATGNFVAGLQRVCTNGGTVASTVNASGVNISSDAASNNFGNQLINTTSGNATLTISNTSALNATGCTIGLSGADSAQFQVVNGASTCNNSNTLNAGGSCTIVVNTTPTSVGNKSASVAYTCTNGPVISVALSSTGTSPSLSFETNNYSYGEIFKNITSPEVVFTLTNTGTASATNCGLAQVTGNYAITADTCGASDLAGGGATCTLTLTSTPLALGANNGTLSRTCAVGGTPAINLTTSGVNVSVSPLTYDYGSASAGTSAGLHTFTYTNNATIISATGCSAPTISNTTDFILNTDNCGNSSLVAGNNCTVIIEAKPQSIAAVLSTTLSRNCTSTGTVSTTANQIVVQGTAKKIIGDIFSNILYGTNGDDIIVGGLGGDVIDGRRGNDQIYPEGEKINWEENVTWHFQKANTDSDTSNKVKWVQTPSSYSLETKDEILEKIVFTQKLDRFNDYFLFQKRNYEKIPPTKKDQNILTGGEGADTFIWSKSNFYKKGKYRDLITDFNPAEGDKIDVSDFSGPLSIEESEKSTILILPQFEIEILGKFSLEQLIGRKE